MLCIHIETYSGFLPTVAGTYQWVASYSGDSNNSPATSTFGSEPETVQGAVAPVIISKRMFIASNLRHHQLKIPKPHRHVQQHHKGKAR